MTAAASKIAVSLSISFFSNYGETSPDIQVLQASVDQEDSSEFRLVDKKFVKYITIDAGIYDLDDMCFEPSLIPLMPPLPSGDWNKGRISRNLDTRGEPYFSAVSKVDLPGITTSWHPTRADHLTLRQGKKLRSNVYEVTCPSLFGDHSRIIVAKFARFEWEVPRPEAETTAYSWIEGHHQQKIGPEFLGHLTEEGRVIGFLMGHVAGCHHATDTPEDLALCRAVLSRLHALGIKHGDVNKQNFLNHDGRATLIDLRFPRGVLAMMSCKPSFVSWRGS